MAAGTLVWQCELRGVVNRVLTVDVEAHARWGIVVDVIGVILWVIPREDLEEGTQRGEVDTRRAREDGTSWHLTADEVLQL
jgi:hypothetical protein